MATKGKSRGDGTENGGGIHVFGFNCPECDTRTHNQVPDEGDRLHCAHCGYRSAVVEDVQYAHRGIRTWLAHAAAGINFPASTGNPAVDRTINVLWVCAVACFAAALFVQLGWIKLALATTIGVFGLFLWAVGRLDQA